ncbi:hypothetical protein ACLB2K_032061 [Fragaria x ananassa]
MIPKFLQMLNETFSIPLQPSPFMYLLLVAISFILLRRWSSNTNSYVPPSPPKLPIIGNLHQVSSLLHRSFQTLSQRYGPVMLLHFGSRSILVISSAEAASQVFKTHDLIFSDRPKFIFFEKVSCLNYTDVVTAPYGEYWRQLRCISVLNLLSNKMVRSYRASFHGEEVRRCQGRWREGVHELAGDLTEFFTRVNIGDYIPWLSWVTRFTGFDAELDDLAKRTDAFFDMVVEEHIDKPNIGDGMKDFVDVLLSVQKENAAGVNLDRVGIKGIILRRSEADVRTEVKVRTSLLSPSDDAPSPERTPEASPMTFSCRRDQFEGLGNNLHPKLQTKSISAANWYSADSPARKSHRGYLWCLFGWRSTVVGAGRWRTEGRPHFNLYEDVRF